MVAWRQVSIAHHRKASVLSGSHCPCARPPSLHRATRAAPHCRPLPSDCSRRCRCCRWNCVGGACACVWASCACSSCFCSCSCSCACFCCACVCGASSCASSRACFGRPNRWTRCCSRFRCSATRFDCASSAYPLEAAPLSLVQSRLPHHPRGQAGLVKQQPSANQNINPQRKQHPLSSRYNNTPVGDDLDWSTEFHHRIIRLGETTAREDSCAVRGPNRGACPGTASSLLSHRPLPHISGLVIPHLILAVSPSLACAVRSMADKQSLIDPKTKPKSEEVQNEPKLPAQAWQNHVGTIGMYIAVCVFDMLSVILLYESVHGSPCLLPLPFLLPFPIKFHPFMALIKRWLALHRLEG